MINPLDWDLGNVPPGIAWGGVDEAGRGAWAGPVVAACAVLDAEVVQKWGHVLRGVRDSKQLNPDRRAALAAELKALLPAYGIGVVDTMAIDRENILEATMMAMRQAVAESALRPRLLLVDGNQAPRTGLPERLVVEGDAQSCAIGAASILAKAHRDALMVALDKVHAGYGFAQHKGYGTAHHREALDALGASSIHRLSYAPVAARQRVDEGVRDSLHRSLDACDTLEALHAWIERDLRPSYGRLKLVWVETLRRRYAEQLVRFAPQDPTGGEGA